MEMARDGGDLSPLFAATYRAGGEAGTAQNRVVLDHWGGPDCRNWRTFRRIDSVGATEVIRDEGYDSEN